MPERLICTDCGHLWHRDVLAERGADRCVFCSGLLVSEAEEPPRDLRPQPREQSDDA